ncbi:hypothetical protein PAPYR_259 [Paratrimastix pyriformis]|uniref:Di19 zinc-binding domain-containing protein n=1 Tax=Paratrimastix pyriformis TaxID=342808 RepID=A0ABQ8UV88_9EUKA|nr:hypothetical protein PAPYR_259 [Paratrimastix pyriformis]
MEVVCPFCHNHFPILLMLEHLADQHAGVLERPHCPVCMRGPGMPGYTASFVEHLVIHLEVCIPTREVLITSPASLPHLPSAGQVPPSFGGGMPAMGGLGFPPPGQPPFMIRAPSPARSRSRSPHRREGSEAEEDGSGSPRSPRADSLSPPGSPRIEVVSPPAAAPAKASSSLAEAAASAQDIKQEIRRRLEERRKKSATARARRAERKAEAPEEGAEKPVAAPTSVAAPAPVSASLPAPPENAGRGSDTANSSSVAPAAAQSAPGAAEPPLSADVQAGLLCFARVRPVEALRSHLNRAASSVALLMGLPAAVAPVLEEPKAAKEPLFFRTGARGDSGQPVAPAEASCPEAPRSQPEPARLGPKKKQTECREPREPREPPREPRKKDTEPEPGPSFEELLRGRARELREERQPEQRQLFRGPGDAEQRSGARLRLRTAR